MKKIILACATMFTATTGIAHAQITPAYELSYNVAVTSEYSFRGVAQTDNKPALQAGIDYSHSSGVYLGAWASPITWIKDAGGDANIETNLYGGIAGDLGNGFSYDVGGLYYYYPGNDMKAVGGANANTFEVYGKVGYGPAYVKYSHAVTNLFGALGANGEKTKGSGYLDVGADFELGGGYLLNLHAGYQTVRKNSAADYADWSVGVSKDFGLFEGSLALVGTDIKPKSDLTETRVILSLSKSF